MIGVAALSVANHGVDKTLGVENVITHRCQYLAGGVGKPDRLLRLLVKGGDAGRVILLDFDDPELVGQRDRLTNRRNGKPETRRDVGVDHLTEVHPVDVIGTDDDDDVRLLVTNEVEALEDRVG